MPGPVPIHTVIPASATGVSLAPARNSRRGMMIYNKSVQILYVKYAADVSLTSFMVAVPENWWVTMPWGEVYEGQVWGIWAAADASGSAQVTELIH